MRLINKKNRQITGEFSLIIEKIIHLGLQMRKLQIKEKSTQAGEEEVQIEQ